MIRKANASDVPAILEHGRKFHSHGAFPGAYNPEHFGAVVEGLIAADEAVVLMSETGSAAFANVPMLITGEMSSQELWWFDDGRNGLALLEAIEREAIAAGSSRLMVSCEVKMRGPAVSRLLKMRGFEPMDLSHIKRIGDPHAG